MPHERPPVRVFPVKGMRINVSTDITVQYSTVQYIQYIIVQYRH